jgi:trehalose 2-sulfotransferase
MAAGLSYIVASSPRTGSYLLCEGLEATGIAGRPTEVFSPHFEWIWRDRWSLNRNADFAEYLDAARLYGTTSNDIYGLKIHWMHVATLAQQACFEGESSAVLDHLFPGSAFVQIVRRDRRGQALSYFRARATNEWWCIEGVQNCQKNGLEPAFDAETVLMLEEDLEEQDRAWEQYFLERRIVPLIVEYEELTRDYRGQIARVLAFLGLDPSAATLLPPPRLVRQSDYLTSHWRQMTENYALARGRRG